MPRSMLHLALACLALFTLGSISHAGDVSYTDRGKTDFDTVLEILNSQGTWSRIDNSWAFTPTDHQAPYTHGRWIYTEYGWYWKGDLPHSWVTEHYGYWKRGADKVWSWYPGPYWLPEIVELRETSTHVGWRSAAVDHDGDFIEQPAERYAKTDEWTFVTRAQFANPITPGLAASPEAVKELLDDSTEARHTYFTYRALDRPGPHPADFFTLCKDGGMYAPKTLQDELATQHPAPSPLTPLPHSPTGQPMTGTNAPALLGAEPNQNVDKRKVKYWITMSLPTYWTKPPAEAKPEEMYLYRPDFYQDDDGIARRILLWFNPQARTSLREALGGNLQNLKSNPGAASATPAEPAQSRGAFQSPLDESYHGKPTPNASTKNPAPSGLVDPKAPIPPPVGTNAAPVNPH